MLGTVCGYMGIIPISSHLDKRIDIDKVAYALHRCGGVIALLCAGP